MIAIADGSGVVPETYETNNTRAATVRIGPDLVVSSMTGPGAAGAGQTVTVAETDIEDRNELGELVDRFRSGKQSELLVLFGKTGRGAVHVALTDDLVRRRLKAGDLVNRIAALSGGKGSCRPHFASAGAGDPARLDEARAAVPSLLPGWLGG